MTNRVFEHVKWHPTPADLRGFGLAMLGGFAVIGAITAWRAGGVTSAVWTLWIVGAALAAAAFIPRLGRGAYLLVHVPTSVIGFVVSPIVLTLVFLLVVVPVALLLRLSRRDALHAHPEPPRARWMPLEKPDRARYHRQF